MSDQPTCNREEEGSAAGETVSVIIPMYNSAETIDRTLASVRCQTHEKLEIIVVDDGSTDDGPKIVERHAREDERIRLLRQRNAGVAAARNAAIEASTGAYIAPVDADDLWHPLKIEKQLAALGGDGPIGLVYCWYSIIDADDRVLLDDCRSEADGDALEAMAMRNVVGHGSGALMLREAVLRAGCYDKGLRAQNGEGCEDYKLYFQIAENYHFALVRECLVGYRETQANMSSDPRKALRSRDLCVPDFITRHPELARHFHSGRMRLMRFMLGRAIRYRRLDDAYFLIAQMARLDPMRLAASIAQLARGLIFRVARQTGKKRRFPIGRTTTRGAIGA